MGGRVYDDLRRAWVDAGDGEFMGEVPCENWVLALAGGECRGGVESGRTFVAEAGGVGYCAEDGEGWRGEEGPDCGGGCRHCGWICCGAGGLSSLG